MKNSKLLTIISVVIFLLQTVAEAVTATVILRLKMLPNKYIVVLVAALTVLLLLTAVLLFVKRKQKNVGLARRIVAWILAVLIICGCGTVIAVASDAYRTMHTVTTNPVTTNARNMYVFVRTEDPAQDLADAADYSFGIIADYDTEHTEKAIEVIGDAVGKQIAVQSFESATAVADALLSEQLGAVIMNGVSITLLTENEGYTDFTQKVKILHTMALADLEPTQETTVPETTAPVEDNVTNTPFVVYISGSDTTSDILNVSRSDVNILMVVHPVTKQVLLLNTPRDYYVPNPAGNGKLDKLTHCGIYGIDCSMQALEDLYDTQINYYGQINFTGFETLVDAVGGVTVYSDQSFTTGEGIYISKGENNLNGEQALAFARDRYHVSGGDNGRGKNQMKVITAVIQKMTSGTTIISNYSSILKSLEGMFATSFTMDDISMLVKMQLSDMASWNIQSFAVSGFGGSEKTYSMPGTNAYVMYPDEDKVAYASALIQRVLAGETLTAEDMNYTG